MGLEALERAMENPGSNTRVYENEDEFVDVSNYNDRQLGDALKNTFSTNNSLKLSNHSMSEAIKELQEIINEKEEYIEVLKSDLKKKEKQLSLSSNKKSTTIRFEDYGLRIPYHNLEPKFTAYPLMVIGNDIIGCFIYNSIGNEKVASCKWGMGTGVCKDTAVDFNGYYDLQRIR